MFQVELDEATPQKKLGFDLSGVDDESFWDGAEQLILNALSDYADQAESNADQKRLFAEDAAKGFAFIDLCRKRFDVVLMNPPFGDPSRNTKKHIEREYTSGHRNIMCAFVERGSLKLHKSGLLGAISARPPLFTITFESWRNTVLFEKSSLFTFADLGGGVLDGAMIEACCYTIKSERFDSNSSFLSVEFDSKFNEIKITNQTRLDLIARIPGMPIAYWATNNILENFSIHKSLEGNFASARQGLGTGDDFRFCRIFSELPPGESNKNYPRYALGGSFSPYFEDLPMCVNWTDNGSEMKAFENWRVDVLGKPARGNGPLRESVYYLKAGLTFPRRTKKLCIKIMPRNTIFSVAGQGIFAGEKQLTQLLPILSTEGMAELAQLMLGNLEHDPQFEVGVIKRLPIPTENLYNTSVVEKALKIVQNIKEYLSYFEDSSDFVSNFIRCDDIRSYVENILALRDRLLHESVNLQCQIEDEINPTLRAAYSREEVESKISSSFRLINSRSICFGLLSYLLGVAFGRWDARNIDENRKRLLEQVDVFTELAILPPGSKNIDERIAAQNIFQLDDRPNQLVFSIVHVMQELWGQEVSKQMEEGILREFEVADFSEIFTSNKLLFEYHLNTYSKARRTAPVYWMLQTSSGDLTLWIYYHRLNEQTLYICVNDYVDPKIKTVVEELNDFRSRSSRNAQEERDLAQLADLVIELKDFRDELLRIARFWKPNLNDGVQITAAPLWKLFQHKAWQKKLKETWESLEKGDYDWAHLACNIWPERVLRKCHQDRSLAIAHDVEDIFWHEVEVPVKRGKKSTGQTKLEWQPKALSDAELNARIQAKIEEMRA